MSNRSNEKRTVQNSRTAGKARLSGLGACGGKGHGRALILGRGKRAAFNFNLPCRVAGYPHRTASGNVSK
jgi:hypothetical protein